MAAHLSFQSSVEILHHFYFFKTQLKKRVRRFKDPDAGKD